MGIRESTGFRNNGYDVGWDGLRRLRCERSWGDVLSLDVLLAHRFLHILL